MQGYRDTQPKFREANTQVLGISVDSPFAQREFAKQNGVEFPLLSDMKHEVSKAYGVFNEDRGTANRATFVVDREGIIRSIELGNSAVNVGGALTACQAIR